MKKDSTNRGIGTRKEAILKFKILNRIPLWIDTFYIHTDESRYPDMIKWIPAHLLRKVSPTIRRNDKGIGCLVWDCDDSVFD